MKRRIIASCVLSAALHLSVQTVFAQRTNLSDVSGASAGLFSRGVVRAFGAPPAPPPVLIVSQPLLDALCLERADAMFAYATMSAGAATAADRTALALMRTGPAADTAELVLTHALRNAGADSARVAALVSATKGLLSSDHPQVVPIATSVERYNDVITSAPFELLAQPPAELMALRVALGKLTASANQIVYAERVYPGLKTAGMRYANDARWVVSGEPIRIGGNQYTQYGQAVAVGDRSFRHISDQEGVWVLAEEPVEPPAIVYVPLRKYCDVELLPYKREQKVIKK